MVFAQEVHIVLNTIIIESFDKPISSIKIIFCEVLKEDYFIFYRFFSHEEGKIYDIYSYSLQKKVWG